MILIVFLSVLSWLLILLIHPKTDLQEILVCITSEVCVFTHALLPYK